MRRQGDFDACVGSGSSIRAVFWDFLSNLRCDTVCASTRKQAREAEKNDRERAESD
jgi:hypothetical protein